MTLRFSIEQDDPVAPGEAHGTPNDAPSDHLAATPPSGEPEATAHARMAVALVEGCDPDAEIRIDPADKASNTADDGADAPRPVALAWRATALGLAACLGAAAGSAGLAAIEGMGPPMAQADPRDEVGTLKEAVAQLQGHVKVVGDNVAALRANFNNASSAVTAQLVKISDEVQKVERLQSDHRAASSAPESAAPPSASETKPAKPLVVEGWVLRAASDGVALLEGRHGVIEVEAGDSVPGVGRIHEIKRQDGHWVVVTPKGLIVSQR